MRSLVIVGILCGIAGAAACGGSPTTPATPTAGAGPVTSNPMSVAGCATSMSAGGGPITDPNGPYFHHIAVADTANGLALTGATDALSHASVPDVSVLPDGSLGVYYVNGEDGGVWMARLDGHALAPVGPISLDGVSLPQGVVDPNATLYQGQVRLTYLFGLGTSTHNICIAESTDGLAFKTRSLAMSFAGSFETDPSSVQLPDGSWLMAVSRGTSTLLARSSDGLTFAEYSQVPYGGVPELALTTDNRVRLYVCAPSGIDAYASSDSGANWTPEGTVTGAVIPGRPAVCDPSALPSHNLFVFKTQ